MLNLPSNGIRLRFDGLDQRLRLIEVLSFTKTRLNYKSLDLVKLPELTTSATSNFNHDEPTGPIFRHVYNRLMGPTFPGEYIPPKPGSETDAGLYILSYPGIAFTFPLKNSAWSRKIDFVALLSSNAASQAKSLAIFNGHSWQDARHDIYVRSCPNPRSLALSSRGKEFHPDEVDLVKIRGNGKIEIIRRSLPPFLISLSETTPQALVAELGPPDAMHRKNDRRLSIHKTRRKEPRPLDKSYGASPGRYEEQADTDQSSTYTATDESDAEDDPSAANERNADLSAECFYNYFHHGFDILISYPLSPSPPLSSSQSNSDSTQAIGNIDHLVAAKILLHGNVPGSYPFNRYRRSRWIIDHPSLDNLSSPLSSETPFEDVSKSLRHVWKDSYANEKEEKSSQRGMVLNRGWGDSPGSSCELLGGWEESTGVQKGRSQTPVFHGGPGCGNTELFGFPGMVFEVLKNDTISCVTIY